MPEHGYQSRPGVASLDDAIQCYYGMGQEQNRLLSPPGDVERLRTRNLTDPPQYFTTAYFHRPHEFRAEIYDARFQDVKVLGIEGPAWGKNTNGPPGVELSAKLRGPELLA